MLEQKSHVHVLSMSKIAPVTEYFSRVIMEDYATGSFRPTESEKTVKQPMERPRKHLLESNGHACRRKRTKTIVVRRPRVSSLFDTSTL